ncbi:glycosyltransferase [Dickeya sp. NCPPB 3274]|uniref:glycosyltransferase family 8 protein n=1 Tax=Dickeya sp. NCPPB 3274 TaxID=568766 RepID=UPI00039CFEAC|nr:glycosyltransferase [Dickeya sp. NCPPB 3274]
MKREQAAVTRHCCSPSRLISPADSVRSALPAADATSPQTDKELATGKQAPQPRQHAIFFCIDASYNVAACVALTSLVMSTHHTEARLPDIYLFVLPESHAVWEDIATHLSQHHRAFRLYIISTLDIPLDESRAQYGFQNYGKTLSIAAYTRLYASRYLHQRGVSRALYLDSDIIIQHSPLPLLHIDMAGFPLAARTERNHPRVSRAIRLHRIPNNRYFNSGVLLLDLQHPAVLSMLNSAIAYSEQHHHHLLYLDQCALNKAVQGLYLGLNEKYNWFMLPEGPLAYGSEQAAIVHFISTPKPWESSYGGWGAALWQRYQRHAITTVSEPLFYALRQFASRRQ